MPMDRTNYPPNWEEISKHIRFCRANGYCEFCGASHGMPHPETGSLVILTTAHLDHDTTNNDHTNLKALCQKCHLNYDAPLHAQHAAEKRRQALIDAGQLEMFQALEA